MESESPKNERRRIGSIGELNTKGKALYVILRRSGGFDARGRVKAIDVEVPLDHALSAMEREQIDNLYPDPLAPRETNPITGMPFLDTTNAAWLREVNETLPRKRREARVVRMLGSAQFGGQEVQTKEGMETAALMLRSYEGITPGDIESIDYQGRSPHEVTEEGIARKEQELSPGTPAPPSA